MSIRHFVILGFFCGVVYFFSPGTFCILLIVALIVAKINRKLDPETKFLINLFLSAFILRLFLLLVFSTLLVAKGKILSYPGYPGWAPNFIGDSAYYTLRGYWMALDWRGLSLSSEILGEAYNSGYGWHGYTYLIGGFHYFFGFSPMSSVILNCIFGALIPVLCYFIARLCFTEAICKIFAVITAFLPSLVIWSVANLKDIPLILTTLFILWSFMMFIKSRRIPRNILFLLLMAVGLLAQSTLRAYIMPLTVTSMLIAYFAISKYPSVYIKIFMVIIAVFLSVALFKITPARLDHAFRQRIFPLLTIHQAAVIEGTNYRILEDKYYLINPDFQSGKAPDEYYYLYPATTLTYRQYLTVYIKGVFHFMFEPFLQKTGSITRALSYPQMILWYILTPFAVLGLAIVMRYRWREYLVLFSYFVIVVSASALTQANIGTVFRFRDMITPVFLFWASIGLVKIAGGRLLKEREV